MLRPRPLITRIPRPKLPGGHSRLHDPTPPARLLPSAVSLASWRTFMPPRTAPLERIGVGIDTARYGHRVSFLRPDRQPAAKPLTVLENLAGYQTLQQRL